MKRFTTLILLVLFLAKFADTAYGQDYNVIWKEFRTALANGEITSDRVRPYYEVIRESILGFLKDMKKAELPEKLEGNVEVFRVGEQLHFLTPVLLDGNTQTYCFSLLIEGDKWYFRHMESINLRLDKVVVPASKFPDISESQKAWMREERYWTQMLQFYSYFLKEKGKENALKMFQDGAGYFLEARTWVPFLPEKKAFILFLCWEQSNLKGNDVTLEQLTDSASTVLVKPIYFKLYKQTAHFRNIIDEVGYREIFEFFWQDRAKAAGWNLRIEYIEKNKCRFFFTLK